jgi:uncharacterized protein (TIGR03067 family)
MIQGVLIVQRFMLPTLFTVLLVGLVRAQVQPGADDAKILQGEWVITEFESDNLKIAAPPDSSKGILRFTGDKFEVVGDKKTGTWKLGKDKDLTTIDIIPDQEKEKGIKGLYKLEGDTLRICIMNGPDAMTRPKEFNSRSPQTIFTLKREKVK